MAVGTGSWRVTSSMASPKQRAWVGSRARLLVQWWTSSSKAVHTTFPNSATKWGSSVKIPEPMGMDTIQPPQVLWRRKCRFQKQCKRNFRQSGRTRRLLHAESKRLTERVLGSSARCQVLLVGLEQSLGQPEKTSPGLVQRRRSGSRSTGFGVSLGGSRGLALWLTNSGWVTFTAPVSLFPHPPSDSENLTMSCAFLIDETCHESGPSCEQEYAAEVVLYLPSGSREMVTAAQPTLLFPLYSVLDPSTGDDETHIQDGACLL